MRKDCATASRGGIPADCASVIETAAGLMMFGDREIGRQMLQELLAVAERSGCASRQNCTAVVEKVAELLSQEQHAHEQQELVVAQREARHA